MSGRMLLLVSCTLALPACGHEDPVDTAPEGDTDTDTDTDTDLPEGSVGRIRVDEHRDQLHEEATGALVRWGPLETPWDPAIDGEESFGCRDGLGDRGVFRRVATVGECELSVLDSCSGACLQDCAPDTYCPDGDGCIPEPQVADAGIITIGGLAVPILLTYQLDGGQPSYSPVWDLPADLYGPGDPVTFLAPGAVLPGFEATVAGPEALEATLPCADIPSTTEDLTITWTPSGAHGARVRWEMKQEVHLTNGPRIRCETDDDGSLTLPASLMADYLVAERQTLVLTRFVQQRVDLGTGRTLDLEVASSVGCIINEDQYW